MEQWKVEQLKVAFRANDASGNGRLDIDEFIALLKKGDKQFPDSQAEQLFHTADQDLSGEVDFDEFVDYIFDSATKENLFRLENSASEEYAKDALMSKPAKVRRDASKAAKSRGERWGDKSWRQRLEEVCELEKELSEETEVRQQCAPTKDETSRYTADSTRNASPGGSKARRRTVSENASPSGSIGRRRTDSEGDKAVQSASLENDEEASQAVLQTMNLQLASFATADLGPAHVIPKKKFAIAAMSQSELVDYSLQMEDLEFAGGDPEALEDFAAFKEHLKAAPDPTTITDVKKFIAKGTAGWVFLAENNQSGKKVAMKLIRMTQASTGLKEWYVSKILRNAGITNGVFCDELVCVLDRSSAPPVVDEQLKNAGPVPYYMALFQQLMPWGTLEDLAKNGDISPLIMFRALQDVAETLAAMHALGLQHRDVKPENIMIQMTGNTVVAAKVCDFGRCEIGDNPEGRWDDIRRFGITFFSVATGEGWTKNRLIREQHDALVSRLASVVEGNPALANLPSVLKMILSGDLSMEDIADLMEELELGYSN